MRRGFTLVELLVALAILGMITLMLAASTRFGLRAWHRTDALEATAGELGLVRATLARDLALAYPEWNASDPTAPVVGFDGTERRLGFLAPAPQAMGGAGFARYLLAAGEDGRLTLAATFETAPDPPDRASVLLEQASSIAFAYYGSPDGQAAPVWQPSWRNRRSLPLLIRIRVRLADGDERRWPDLVVAPHLATDALCVYDPLTYHCRGR